jgi:hypothetical protein
MAFDAALAAIVVAVRGNAYLWVLALVLFLYSVGWAVQPLFIDQPEAAADRMHVMRSTSNDTTTATPMGSKGDGSHPRDQGGPESGRRQPKITQVRVPTGPSAGGAIPSLLRHLFIHQH